MKTFLGADAEECHKQWLALGLISVLVSKVQSSKVIPLVVSLIVWIPRFIINYWTHLVPGL